MKHILATIAALIILTGCQLHIRVYELHIHDNQKEVMLDFEINPDIEQEHNITGELGFEIPLL